MSPSGITHCCSIWDYSYDLGNADDEIGGAVPSGTILYRNVEIRIQSAKPTQALLEQGVESLNIFTGFIPNFTLDIENNNEIEITAPINSPYYGDFFAIKGDPRRTSTGASDSRGYLLVSLQRIERGRTIQ